MDISSDSESQDESETQRENWREFKGDILPNEIRKIQIGDIRLGHGDPQMLRPVIQRLPINTPNVLTQQNERLTDLEAKVNQLENDLQILKSIAGGKQAKNAMKKAFEQDLKDSDELKAMKLVKAVKKMFKKIDDLAEQVDQQPNNLKKKNKLLEAVKRAEKKIGGLVQLMEDQPDLIQTVTFKNLGPGNEDLESFIEESKSFLNIIKRNINGRKGKKHGGSQKRSQQKN